MGGLGTGDFFVATNPDDWENAAEDFSPPDHDDSLDEGYEFGGGGKDDAFEAPYD